MPAISWWAVWGVTLYSVGCTLAQSPFEYNHQELWGGDCNVGLNQSPVNLEDTTLSKLGTLWVRYPEIENEWKVINNGHGLELAVKDGNLPKNRYRIGGANLPDTYRLVQIHFHWGTNNGEGSEHQVNGTQYAGEMHLVHVKRGHNSVTDALKSKERDALAVIGVFLKIGETSNPAINEIFKQINFTDVARPSTVSVRLTLSLTTLLSSGPTYRYMGSLTTPSCNEAVVWTVLGTPAVVTMEQLEMLRSLHNDVGKPVGGNFRKTQPINCRDVKLDPSLKFRKIKKSGPERSSSYRS